MRDASPLFVVAVLGCRMASLERDTNSGQFRIRFRYAGRPYKRTLKTRSDSEANAILGRIEETLSLITRGRLVVPGDVDPGAFILSDGQINGKPERPTIGTVAELFDTYLEQIPPGAKEPDTFVGEKRHMKYLKKHLGHRRAPQSLTAADMQGYVNDRLSDKWRGKPIQAETIKKELATFRLIWNWAVDRRYLDGRAPVRGVKLPKRPNKPPFMTWSEIQANISRSTFSETEEQAMWECLFLTVDEIQQLIKDVKIAARHPFVYPMFVFAAHTGARRSEIVRSEVGDVDLRTGTVQIREKKRSRERSVTFRQVPMSNTLQAAMIEWLNHDHPGGRYTFGIHRDRPMSRDVASHHFTQTVRRTKWKKLRGFHVLRHSFASNLAAGGVDQRIIDEWMGHQTEEMRKRYRHLIREQHQQVVESIFAGNGQ